jgi:hypothetical protein
VTNTCTAFYVDQDADGYGTGQAKGFCGTTTPVGYSAQTGDCCDDPAHLAVAQLIHPNAAYQTTSAGGVCGITWDFNCSGQTEQTAQNVTGCTAYPSCQNMYGNFPDSDCGMAVGVGSCGTASNNTTSCISVGVSAGVLGCR